MPKITLEFNFPEEQTEFSLAMRAPHLSCVINNIDNYLRGRLKYETLSDDTYAALQAVRDKLHEFNRE